jgi:hypothetical protein
MTSKPFNVMFYVNSTSRSFLHRRNLFGKKRLQFLPYGRSIGSWICPIHKTYTCHTVQNTIRYDIRFTGMKVRYTIFERVTMYNDAKRTLRKLQRFISLLFCYNCYIKVFCHQRCLNQAEVYYTYT